jgi:FkbM family methyltransferase
LNHLPLYVGNHTILTKLSNGPRIFLDTRDPVCLEIAVTGLWEDHVTQVFLSTVKNGMTVLDIGAHCGYYSMLAGMLVGQSGAVHAFEPNPFYHKNMLKSIGYNGFKDRVRLNRLAVSNTRGEMKLRAFGEGGASIFFPGAESLNGVTETTVPVGLISDYLPSLKVDVIKIDIDGGEPLIMDNLMQIINTNGSMTVFLEYCPLIYGGYPPESVLRPFVETGFSFHIIQRNFEVKPTNADFLADYGELEHIDLMLVR